MNLSEYLSDLTNSSRIITLRDFIIGFSIVMSSIVYTYFMDYYNSDNDFINRMWGILTNQKKSYSFYSDNIDADATSIYAKIGKALKNHSDRDPDLNVILKGKTGSAYENAFGVMNNKQAFGLIQSDTYLNVPNLRENTIEIAPIYMERLHIICHCDSSIKKFEELFDTANYQETLFYIGKPGSSSNLMFPLLKSHFNGSKPPELDNIDTKANFTEMSLALKNLDDTVDYKNVVVMFMMGYNQLIKEVINDSKNQLRLLEIDAAKVYDINEKFGQKFIPTYFPQDFYPSRNVATIGALATIIASNDLKSNEIANFLKVFEQLNLSSAFNNIFDNPSFSIVDISNKYRTLANAESWSLLKTIIVFTISVTLSSYVLAVLLIYIISAFKQSNYYKEMMSIYRDITELNSKKAKVDNESNIWRTQTANGDRLIDGIKKLNQLGQIVREDFNTGGMTIRHHSYLIDNLNYLEKWFQSKLTSRIAYALNNIPPDSQEEKESIKEQIEYLYGNSFLLNDQYTFLISLIIVDRND